MEKTGELLIRTCFLVESDYTIAVIHRLETAAVNGHHRFRKQIKPTTQHDKLAAYLTDRLAVILAKISNRFEVRCQALEQPHPFHIALRLVFQTPARLSAIEVTIDTELQQH